MKYNKVMKYDSEYKELHPSNDLQKRKEYWEIAKGLQQVDGLTTSEFLETVIADTVSGKYDTQTAKQKVVEYYTEIAPDSPAYENKEGDIVTARITAYLEIDDFKFSPVLLKSIHKKLFQDIFPYDWVGVYRVVNISKEEDVLGGKSVRYADHSNIQDYLEYDFWEEQKSRYALPFTSKQIGTIADFTSKIWQTHPFREGNTRAIATFIIKYLRHLGVEINNDPFIENAKWFRDALVRSNYANLQEGVHADPSYLMMFFENILMNAGHDLCSIDQKSVRQDFLKS